MVDYLEFPAGLRLLSRWQSGDAKAKQALRALIDETIDGLHDRRFAEPTPTDRVHTTTSVHMLALDILNDLYGTTTAEYYKTNPDRYARVNLMAFTGVGSQLSQGRESTHSSLSIAPPEWPLSDRTSVARKSRRGR